VPASESLDFGTVWTAAGVVVGFSVTAFLYRIKREAEIRSGAPLGEGLYWLPPADFALLGSLVVVLVGVFVLPVLGAGLAFARYALGWAFLLLAGYPFALIGHYEILFGKVPEKTIQRRVAQGGFPWATEQEKGVLAILAAASVIYFVAVAIRELE
jgi:hypothetical protein